jgi:NADH-quinone oxidoreductase subunit N
MAPMTQIPNLWPVFPELVLALGSMGLLMLSVFTRENTRRGMAGLAIVLFAIAGIFMLGQQGSTVTMSGMFATDPYIRFMKGLVLIGSAVTMGMAVNFLRAEKIFIPELPILIILATLGMLMMISANGLISLYVGLELQSLSLYVLAAIRRNKARASEAGLKYFVLGALSSGLLLYGASLIYGFTGSVSFTAIAEIIGKGETSLGLTFGLVFLIAGLAFKISAVPFHMWTPDVYEGAPTPITAFFAAAPKLAAMALIIRVLFVAFPGLAGEWQQVIVFLAIASMFLGAFAAIGQTNIKRLMAYSSIGHMGFALVGMAAANPEGVRGLILYMIIYMVMTLGAFACILAMRRQDTMVESIHDLAGLGRTSPAMALMLMLLMFSLAGIPPLAGFFAKFYVFLAAVKAGLFPLAILGILSSVVGAFYYLRIVKIMYFDEPAEEFDPMPNELAVVLGVAGVFVLFFGLYPTPLLSLAAHASAVLF